MYSGDEPEREGRLDFPDGVSWRSKRRGMSVSRNRRAHSIFRPMTPCSPLGLEYRGGDLQGSMRLEVYLGFWGEWKAGALPEIREFGRGQASLGGE